MITDGYKRFGAPPCMVIEEYMTADLAQQFAGVYRAMALTMRRQNPPFDGEERYAYWSAYMEELATNTLEGASHADDHDRKAA